MVAKGILMFLKTGDRVIYKDTIQTVQDVDEAVDRHDKMRVCLSSSGWVDLGFDNYWERQHNLCVSLFFNIRNKKNVEKQLKDLEDYYTSYKQKLLENLRKFT